MKKIIIKKNKYWLGKKMSQLIRNKMSKNNARYWKGKKFSKTHCDNLSNSHKGKHGRCLDIGTKRIISNSIQIKVNEGLWMYEHRYLVEQYIGRKLKSTEIVHHIDSNRKNNKLSNLYIFKNIMLHSSFEVLVRFKIINKFILKSNLKEFKI
jgi:hypothetical protein